MIFFNKYQVLGNDFIISDNIIDSKNISLTARFLCDRHFGIGSDGLILYSKENNTMKFYNPDGSTAEMCGNGIACLADYLYQKFQISVFHQGQASTSFNPMTKKVETIFESSNSHTSVLPKVSNPLDYYLNLGGKELNLSSIFLGTIHTIFIVEEFDDFLFELGPQISCHSLYPEGTNVNFVKVINRQEVEVRTFERGAGWTLSCGTGNAATIKILFQKNLIDKEAVIGLAAGRQKSLIIDDKVILESYPVLVYRGEIDEKI